MRATSPDEPAVSGSAGGSLPFRAALTRVVAFLKDKLGAHFGQVRILAAVLALSLFVACGIWLAFSGYDMISSYLAARDSAPPASESTPKAREDNADADYEKARHEAQQALAEAERIRQINVARMEADKYQWATWLHTLRDIADNNKRLREKQIAAEAQAEEERRLARIEEQKKVEEVRRKAAAMTASRPARPDRPAVKKHLRSFE